MLNLKCIYVIKYKTCIKCRIVVTCAGRRDWDGEYDYISTVSDVYFLSWKLVNFFEALTILLRKDTWVQYHF